MAEITQHHSSEAPLTRALSSGARVAARVWVILLWCAAHLIASFSAEFSGRVQYIILANRPFASQAMILAGIFTALFAWTYVFSHAGSIGVVAFWLAIGFLLYRGAFDRR